MMRQQALKPQWPPPDANLLPAPGYLELCARAHARAGLLDHLLDTTLLHDGRALRDYVRETPEVAALVDGARHGRPPTYPHVE